MFQVCRESREASVAASVTISCLMNWPEESDLGASCVLLYLDYACTKE